MPLTKLQFRPGITRETTSYSNEGGWIDIDKVRFRFGYPEKIGGWVKKSNRAFLGTCRALHPWVSIDGSNYIGIGTHLKFYIEGGGAYNDITPIRVTTGAGDVTFSASANRLRSGVGISDTTLPLTSSSGFPAFGRIRIDSEIIIYESLSGNDLTGCVRGVSDTIAAPHLSGADVNCATLIVSDVAHGAGENDFVTYSDAVSLGGAVTDDVLNQEYQITRIIDDDRYQIEARTVSRIDSITTSIGLDPVYVFATPSDGGDGGSASIGAYQINTALDSAIFGNGWGAGFWGRGAWGSPSISIVTGETLRIWTQDNFGEDLIFSVFDRGIYYWKKADDLSVRGVELGSMPGANKAPTIAKKILVSGRDRHVIAFGCDSETNPNVQDPLLIRFSDQENVMEWQSLVTNTAGDLRIGSGSKIITAIKARNQILVYTDASLHAMQYLGPPFTFGISEISQNISIISPLAAIAVEDSVYWMGKNEFYVYGGTVNILPCSVLEFVFNDINNEQLEKIAAAKNSEFSEVTWFYPSSSSRENDRYVTYNYQQKIWYYGTLDRTFWIDRGVNSNIIASGSDNHLYFHETGFDDGSTSPAGPIISYIESSQMDLGDGEQFVFMNRMIPDITFRNSSNDAPSVTITLKVRNFPGGNYTDANNGSVIKTASAPVEQFTDQIFVRLRGRSFAVRVESDETGVGWRLGSPRVEVRPDGRR